ncbi:MAG: glycosyltransferase [Oscillospiraceae bacterium]|jgi:glycosyltransferase involved in cell wall biosynthesis|nr:glycosyltransferase [Oscillospiraceae bacterium]
MKFLYASFVSDTKQYSGILKKVAGQTDGVARLGFDAHYTCVDGDSVLLNTGGGSPERKAFAYGLRWRDRQNAVTEKICEFAADGSYDVVYLKGFLSNPYALRVASCAKAANPGCKVIFEIATYPYWGTYRQFLKKDLRTRNMRSLIGHMLEITQHLVTAPRIRKKVDILAVFGLPVKKLWGIPCLMLDNGVSTDRFQLRRPPEEKAEINMLGVAGTTISHGYSRVIEGLARYDRKEQTPVVFNIVGENDTILTLKKQAIELHVEKWVRFLGYKNAKELEACYNFCDIAVSVLGGYLFNLNNMSPIKSREYCAAGIPFLYAYEDTLPADAPFALKIPNNPTPVDMEAVVRFVERCRRHPEISAQEREYAKDHYDWKIIMKRVLDFAGAASKR